MEPFVQSNDDLAITPAEKYQQYQKTLARLAQLSPASFNPAGAIAQDDGKGRLVPNWEGLGNLGGGLLMGRFPVIFEGKNFIGLPRSKGAVPEVPVKASWDPDTKAFHDENGSRLTDEEAHLYLARKGPWIGVVDTPGLPKGAYPEGLWYDGAAREFPVGEKIVSAEEAERIQRSQNPNISEEKEGSSSIEKSPKRQGSPRSTDRSLVKGQNGTELFATSEKLVVEERDGDIFELSVNTSKGGVSLASRITRSGDDLVMEKLDIQGLGKGQLRREGLNEIKHVLIESARRAGIKRILVMGGRRTSGKRKGMVPRAIIIEVK